MNPLAFGLFTLLGLAQITLADPVGPVYPAPGGMTVSSSGTAASAGMAGGRVDFYTGFDDSMLAELYFSFWDVDNPTHSTQGMPGSTGNMTFSGYFSGTGMATWTSTANTVWPNTTVGMPDHNWSTTFRVQFQPYTGTNSGQLVSGWLVPKTATSRGITSLPPFQSVLDVQALSGTDNFQVWYQYTVTATGVPLVDYYNSTAFPLGLIQTQDTEGFYSVAPEPGSVGLLAVGVATLAGVVRRRKLA